MFQPRHKGTSPRSPALEGFPPAVFPSVGKSAESVGYAPKAKLCLLDHALGAWDPGIPVPKVPTLLPGPLLTSFPFSCGQITQSVYPPLVQCTRGWLWDGCLRWDVN